MERGGDIIVWRSVNQKEEAGLTQLKKKMFFFCSSASSAASGLVEWNANIGKIKGVCGGEWRSRM